MEWKDEAIIMNSIGASIVAAGVLISFAVRRSNSPGKSKVVVSEEI